MLRKQALSGLEIDGRGGQEVEGAGGIAKPCESSEDGIHASQRVRLETAKGAQTELREVILDLPDIVLSHGEVVNQVTGTRLVLGRNPRELPAEVPFERERRVPQLAQAVDQLVDPVRRMGIRHRNG